MARKPVEIDPESLLCTACDKQVELDDNDEWQHKAKGIKSHYVTKVVKYADWAAKRTADRTITNKDGVATRGPNVRPAKSATAAPAAKPALKKKTQAERAAIRAQNDADRAKVINERQARQDAMEEAWSEKRGYHIPLVTSVEPVVRPSTGEIYIPSTGKVLHQMDPAGLPPKLGSPERDKLNAGINHLHEDHPWVPVYGLDGTIARSPKINSLKNHFGGMTNWAHMLKRKYDPDNNFEYKVWRAEPVKSGDYRGLPYGVKDITASKRYTWRISARQRFCEKCAPTITLPTGSVRPNPVKSVDRPPMEELDSMTNMDNTTMEDRIGLDVARAGGVGKPARQRKSLEQWQEAFGIDSNKPQE